MSKAIGFGYSEADRREGPQRVERRRRMSLHVNLFDIADPCKNLVAAGCFVEPLGVELKWLRPLGVGIA
jgi:hypothetical protein